MTPATLAAGIIFGTIGFAAFVYAKKAGAWICLVIAIILMVYPYFVSNTLLLWVIGAALTAALYLFRGQ